MVEEIIEETQNIPIKDWIELKLKLDISNFTVYLMRIIVIVVCSVILGFIIYGIARLWNNFIGWKEKRKKSKK